MKNIYPQTFLIILIGNKGLYTSMWIKVHYLLQWQINKIDGSICYLWFFMREYLIFIKRAITLLSSTHVFNCQRVFSRLILSECLQRKVPSPNDFLLLFYSAVSLLALTVSTGNGVSWREGFNQSLLSINLFLRGTARCIPALRCLQSRLLSMPSTQS